MSSVKVARAITRAERGELARHAADLLTNPAWKAVLELTLAEIKNRWAEAAADNATARLDVFAYEVRALEHVIAAMQREANQFVRKGIR